MVPTASQLRAAREEPTKSFDTRRWSLVAIAAAAVLGVVALGSRTSGRNADGTSGPPSVVTIAGPTSSSATATPRAIGLKIDVTPREAAIFIERTGKPSGFGWPCASRAGLT